MRMEHSTEMVRTGKLAQLNKSNRSSSNSACNATEVVFKETMGDAIAHMSKGGSAKPREGCALSVRYCEQRDVRMAAW